MTGADKLKQMIDSGEFAGLFSNNNEQCKIILCPGMFGLNEKKEHNDCDDCWRKALESEVE